MPLVAAAGKWRGVGIVEPSWRSRHDDRAGSDAGRGFSHCRRLPGLVGSARWDSGGTNELGSQCSNVSHDSDFRPRQQSGNCLR